jgi:hypothetical protein
MSFKNKRALEMEEKKLIYVRNFGLEIRTDVIDSCARVPQIYIGEVF